VLFRSGEKLERQHVMKVGNSSQLKLRGRGIALMDKA
jgi:hypothetical protein